MPSSELLNDLTSEPISRRTVAAGLWAAPVIALTVAAPAVAASTTSTISLSQGSGGRWVVNYSNMAASSALTVSVTNSGNPLPVVEWDSGTALTHTSGKVRTLNVTVTGTGSFTFKTFHGATGTVTGGGAVGQNFG